MLTAVLLFVFSSLVLAVLCLRMRNKPSMLQGLKQKWAATAAYVPPKRPTPPPEVVVNTPPGCRDDDFENALIGNAADRVGNPFWGSVGASRHHGSDDE